MGSIEKKVAKEIKAHSQSGVLILKSLVLGRGLVQRPDGSLKWMDNIRYPSLSKKETTDLFQQGLIVPDNSTGKIVLTGAGRILCKKLFF